jgi:rhodanese-related sulfurtransferase
MSGMTRPGIDDLLERARSRFERLEPVQALAAQAAGALLVDTRSTDERQRDGIIPGSVHIPLSVLGWRLDPSSEWRNTVFADASRQVVVVCAHGYSSSLAAALLQELGYGRATDLAGGFAAWRAAGVPVAEAPRPDEGLPGMGEA